MNLKPRQRGLTRRDLLVAGGGAALTSFLWTSPLARAATLVPAPLRRSTYLALTDRRFRARRAGVAGAGWFGVTLSEVADLPRAATLEKYRNSDDAFSLLFAGPVGAKQGIYELEHPVMGRFRLFITPVGRPARSQTYQAIVDRLYS